APKPTPLRPRGLRGGTPTCRGTAQPYIELKSRPTGHSSEFAARRAAQIRHACSPVGALMVIFSTSAIATAGGIYIAGRRRARKADKSHVSLPRSAHLPGSWA